MAEVTLTQPAHAIMSQGHDDAMGSDVYRSRPTTISAPEPNPEFTFPMLPPDSEHDRTSRRSANRSKQLHISTSPLPQFSFPSSVDSTPPTGESIEVSPTRSIPSGRQGGHRRGGSEFIGGDGLLGGSGLMSSSPTKGHGALPSPPVSGRRRGHAHRRSGAISNHDLSSILNPPPTIDGVSRRTGSAPTTPCDPNAHRQFIPSLDRAVSQPTLHQTTSPVSPEMPYESPRESSPATAQSRPRVGFSDTLEFIPRPLSTISTGTSSTLSTVRPSHSLSGSINSIRSGTSSPPSAKKNRLSTELLREQIGDIRPKTADSTFNQSPSASPFRRQVTPPYRPSSASGSKLIKAQLDDYTFEPQSTLDSLDGMEDAPSRFTGGITSETPQFHVDLQKLRGTQVAPHLNRPRSSPEAKVSKRQRKVKSWAGSLLSRKNKSRSEEEEESDDSQATSAPIHDFAPLEGFSLEDMNFDDDTTCVIHSPGYQHRPSPANNVNPFDASSDGEEDPTGVLDLDATWNSLETASPASASSSGFSNAKRRMHSGGTTGGFIGPGMHYHRRAESAPNLLPVDPHAFGFPRLGSCPQMADVFEEEEEDEANKQSKIGSSIDAEPPKENDLTGLGVQIVDVVTLSNQAPRQRTPGHARSHDLVPTTSSMEISRPSSASDSIDRNIMNDFPIEIVDSVEEPRFSVVTKSSDDSTITPTLTSAQLSNGALPISLDFAPAPRSETTETSSNPSPDFGNASFDVPRLGTAHSSITDRSVWSSARTGESGPDTTYSVEDVPSLTSSASTMISGGLVPFSPASTRASGERSFSFSAAVPRRSRPASAAGKRSSLASLSRLVASSYGEKSKLSIESRATDDSGGAEKKKRHRISRMMKFWKSKEKLNA